MIVQLLKEMKNYNSKFVIIKYVLSIILIIMIIYKKDYYYSIFMLLEVGIVFCLTNKISHELFHYLVNSIFMFLVNLQAMFLIYGRTYLTLVMIQNIASLEDLSGKALLYGGSVILISVISFLPERKIEFKRIKGEKLAIVFLILEVICSMSLGNTYSPIYGYYKVLCQMKDQQKIKKISDELQLSAADFFQDGIPGYIDKPTTLSSMPNIVLIFTEGLSQSIMDDRRMIMPNMAAYQKKSLNFTNYYNHTFATYRGLIGQLYSGYQLQNYDSNKLISIQDILKDKGYKTTFINTEPNNPAFVSYIKSLNFETVDGNVEEPLKGMAQSLSDRQAYDKLYAVMQEENKKNQPFFISMYTLGTHVSFDSTDQKYADGQNAMLNKFYNVDYYFGQFMEKFETSTMAENTIVILTTDHCTYLDDSYEISFPDDVRLSWETDRIPLFFYYQGIESASLNANGRNSLDLVPTICDYLDISVGNYFLGCSLFAESGNNNYYDTTFNQSQDYLSTRNDRISELSGEEKEIFISNITRYYSVSRGQ